MRASGKPEFLTDHNNLYGLHLPADFCAEHEWGIERLCMEFGIPQFKETEGPLTIDRFKSTVVPNSLLYQENQQRAALTVGYRLYGETELLKRLPDDLRGSKELIGAWDQYSFGISGSKKDNIKKIRQIKEAIELKNIAVWISSGGAFSNGSLVIGICDKVPEEHCQHMADKLQEQHKLYVAAEATGIEEKLKAKPQVVLGLKSFLGLSPRWIKDKKSKHPVMFWLNPTDQKNNNSGYFTVEELELWLENKGPVLK